MSDQDLSQKLDAVRPDAPFDDPNFYADLLGYNQPDGAAEPPTPTQPPQGDTAKPEAQAPAAESTPTPESAEKKAEPEIAGALTKDGKHVIPYSVVQDLRTTTSQQAERIAELTAAIEQMKAEQAASAEGTSTAATQAQAEAAALQFTEDELADLEAIPAAAKLVKGFQALQQQMAEVARQPQAQPAQPAVDVESVQAAIDANPLLVKWQTKGGELWAKAVQLDAQLQSDPKWAGKPMAERFAHVQAAIADEYGIPVPSAPSAQPAAAHKPSPAARETLPSATDFAGGPMPTGGPMDGMTPTQMVDKAMTMSVEDIRKMVGLSF